MIVSIIVAVSENRVIGKNNSLPWHLPADMKYFREVTMGHCVIMGRKNYDSILLKYRPLEGRTNIVITRQKDFSAEGCVVVHSVQEALQAAQKKNETEAFIIGGADIYNQTLEIADKIYYTHIHHSFEGDAFFPQVDLRRWKKTMQKDVKPDAKNIFPFTYFIYERV
ncbi:MAG TPA: dihydrofolate reductase [Bacteroidia bacterium]